MSLARSISIVRQDYQCNALANVDQQLAETCLGWCDRLVTVGQTAPNSAPGGMSCPLIRLAHSGNLLFEFAAFVQGVGSKGRWCEQSR
jgi:hypothetical protein